MNSPRGVPELCATDHRSDTSLSHVAHVTTAELSPKLVWSGRCLTDSDRSLPNLANASTSVPTLHTQIRPTVAVLYRWRSMLARIRPNLVNFGPEVADVQQHLANFDRTWQELCRCLPKLGQTWAKMRPSCHGSVEAEPNLGERQPSWAEFGRAWADRPQARSAHERPRIRTTTGAAWPARSGLWMARNRRLRWTHHPFGFLQAGRQEDHWRTVMLAALEKRSGLSYPSVAGKLLLRAS